MVSGDVFKGVSNSVAFHVFCVAVLGGEGGNSDTNWKRRVKTTRVGVWSYGGFRTAGWHTCLRYIVWAWSQGTGVPRVFELSGCLRTSPDAFGPVWMRLDNIETRSDTFGTIFLFFLGKLF